MSTAFTHGFVASLLTPFAPRGIRRLPLLIVLVTISILPDIDVLGFRYGIPYSHPWGHRGMTHSIAFSLLLAVLSTFLFYRQARPLSRRWFGLLALLFVAGASHGILDAFTDAGLGVGFFCHSTIPAISSHGALWKPRPLGLHVSSTAMCHRSFTTNLSGLGANGDSCSDPMGNSTSISRRLTNRCSERAELNVRKRQLRPG